MSADALQAASGSPSHPPSGSAPGPAEPPWWVLGATSIGVVAVFLSISGLNVALPTITRELGASASQATWVLLSYMLVTTSLILIFGRLADMLGRRPLYLAGLAVFTLATLACALAPSPALLITARVAQGVGAAAIVTNTTALLTDAFPSDQLARALGLNASVAAVAQVIGPVVGGAVTSWWGWPGLFYLCAPLGVAALVASALVIPPSGRRSHREGFDVAGALLSVTALTATVVGLTPGTADGGRRTWVAGSVAVVAGAALLIVQSRRRHPLIDLTLFRHRARAATYAAVLLQAVSSYAIVLLASLYLQATRGATPLAAGVLITPAAIGTLLAAAAAGPLTSVATPRTLTATGMALTSVGLVGFALTVSTGGGLDAVLVPELFAIGAGTGLFMTPSTAALMLGVPAQRRGIANGLRSALQNVGYLVSTALALVVATAGLDAATRQGAYEGTLDSLGSAQLASFVDAVRTASLMLAALSMAAVVVCLMLPGRVRPGSDVEDVEDAARTARTEPGRRPR